MLPLEPTDDRVNPAFKDAATCTKWLSQLQLTNLNLAQGTLRTRLDEFNRYPLRGKDRLKTLEALRETVETVQVDYARKLFGKKLPLADEEFSLLLIPLQSVAKHAQRLPALPGVARVRRFVALVRRNIVVAPQHAL